MTAAVAPARAIDVARAASARQAARPRHEIAAALAASATRWLRDPALRVDLVEQSRLHPATLAAGLGIAVEALNADAMLALVERELGTHRPQPRVVAHVLASNVPALALPAIALACLAGVAVVLKSGRADRVSASAFHRALQEVDVELAATVVAEYWTGGDADTENQFFGSADVVVATGHDDTVAAIARRHGERLIGHGERASLVVVGRDANDDLAERVAMDVALHDQRGCLSPQAVYVAGNARAFAERLTSALDAVACRLPPGPLDGSARAAHRTAVAEAEWTGATVLGAHHGTVLFHDDPRWRASPGRRTVWVHPLPSLRDVLPRGGVECVGVAGAEVDLALLRELGVSRVCPAGRMQRPPLSWPRGQRSALRSLLGLPSEFRLDVEPA